MEDRDGEVFGWALMGFIVAIIIILYLFTPPVRWVG